MKKSRVRVLMCLSAICLLAGTFFACGRGVAFAEVAYTPSEEFCEVLAQVEKLEKATEAYYHTADTFDAVARYIRSGRYSDVTWQIMVGKIDPAYEKTMRRFSDLREVGNLIVVTDQHGEPYCVDFVHMAAVADSKQDFAGWAGDLITLAVEANSLQEARLLMANEQGAFDAPDFRANIDALNLYELAKENGGSLARAMRSYYLEGGVQKATTAFLLRETGLTEETLSAEAIEAAFRVRLDEETCDEETLLLSDAYGVTGSEQMEYACRAFAEHLYRTYCKESGCHEEVAMCIYPPTCASFGYTCAACRCCGMMKQIDVIPASLHHISVTYTEPSETWPGYKQELCESCGAGVVSEYDVMEAGDLNLDGCLSALDYMHFKRGVLGSCALTPRQAYLADLNGDTLLDVQDGLLLWARLSEHAEIKKTDVS